MLEVAKIYFDLCSEFMYAILLIVRGETMNNNEYQKIKSIYFNDTDRTADILSVADYKDTDLAIRGVRHFSREYILNKFNGVILRLKKCDNLSEVNNFLKEYESFFKEFCKNENLEYKSISSFVDEIILNKTHENIISDKILLEFIEDENKMNNFLQQKEYNLYPNISKKLMFKFLIIKYAEILNQHKNINDVENFMKKIMRFLNSYMDFSDNYVDFYDNELMDVYYHKVNDFLRYGVVPSFRFELKNSNIKEIIDYKIENNINMTVDEYLDFSNLYIFSDTFNEKKYENYLLNQVCFNRITLLFKSKSYRRIDHVRLKLILHKFINHFLEKEGEKKIRIIFDCDDGLKRESGAALHYNLSYIEKGASIINMGDEFFRLDSIRNFFHEYRHAIQSHDIEFRSSNLMLAIDGIVYRFANRNFYNENHDEFFTEKDSDIYAYKRMILLINEIEPNLDVNSEALDKIKEYKNSIKKLESKLLDGEMEYHGIDVEIFYLFEQIIKAKIFPRDALVKAYPVLDYIINENNELKNIIELIKDYNNAIENNDQNGINIYKDILSCSYFSQEKKEENLYLINNIIERRENESKSSKNKKTKKSKVIDVKKSSLSISDYITSYFSKSIKSGIGILPVPVYILIVYQYLKELKFATKKLKESALYNYAQQFKISTSELLEQKNAINLN